MYEHQYIIAYNWKKVWDIFFISFLDENKIIKKDLFLQKVKESVTDDLKERFDFIVTSHVIFKK